VPDQKPPRFAGDERATLLALLDYQRSSLVRKTTGLDDEAARRRLVPSGTSLLWLLKHMTAAETTWVLCRFAGRDVEVPDDAVTPSDTVASAITSYRTVSHAVDEVVRSAPSLDEPCHGIDGANLRWVVAHLLEETARHAGHADILRELIDGQTGR
jgi:uncharacterized damage-inducible protein DinB